MERYYEPIPSNVLRPWASYYGKINWNNGFEKWNLVRFSTEMDGSCFFHAIINAFFTPYHCEIIDNKYISRKQIVKTFRKELSLKLARKDKSGKTYYENINGGNMKEFSTNVSTFTLSYMQGQLDSDAPIGYGYMDFIGQAIDKDIYILEGNRRSVYISDEFNYSITGKRNSIVLYYTEGHYELVGLQENKDSEVSFTTYFSPNHSFIKFLYKRVQECLN